MKYVGEYAIKTLEMLAKHAPKMSLGEAWQHAEEQNNMRYDLMKYEFIIMMLLQLLGVDGNGNLRDKTLLSKLEAADDKVWAALLLATKVHGGYACSPFTPKDWADKSYGELKSEVTSFSLDQYKQSVLNILKSEI